MSLRVRFQYSQGATLGYSIERLADGYNYDFQDGTFKNSTPTTPIASLTAGTGTRAGIYSATLASTPLAQFSNGDYAIYINDTIVSNSVIGVTAAVMYNGDDSTVFATAGGTDPWATILPASYPAGSAGALLGTNLDAKVSTRSTFTGGVVAGVTAPVTVGTNNDKAGYSLAATDHTQIQSEMTSAIAPVKAITDRIKFDPSNLVLASTTVTSQPSWYAAPPTVQQIRGELDTNSTRLAFLDASISSRSTYAGGMVAGVTAPVTVGTNNDKSGYILAASGIDAVMIEPSVNARQALSPILAAAAGAINGAGTGTIVIKGGNSTTSRIMATTDSAGNRSSVVLVLPT
jgi:hypothetical protein